MSGQLSDLGGVARPESMIITPDSHLDHGLKPAHLEYLTKRFADRTAFFIETIELPTYLPTVPCGLYGPAMGDEPVLESEVTYRVRDGRAGPTRTCTGWRRGRRTWKLTVVAGPHEGQPCVLYTAYGGPAAPREPWDPSLSPEEAAESRAFWAVHALVWKVAV